MDIHLRSCGRDHEGREATLRRFIEGGVNTFGTGANCQDPDGDGVTNEITEGRLSAETIYRELRETPVRVPAATAALQTLASSGEALFNRVGCASCHTRVYSNSAAVDATQFADVGSGASTRVEYIEVFVE